jgi:hypothetical protein
MALLKYSQFITEKWSGNSITIFDIDDTLVLTNSKIRVHDPETGKTYELTPKEFNEYQKDPNHVLDFSDFRNPDILKAGRIIDWVMNILQKTLQIERAVGIITARDSKDLVIDFLLHNGVDINPDFIFAVNDPKSNFTGSIAERKQQAFVEFIDMGFKNFKFFDDDSENLKLAKQLEKQYDITMQAKLVKSNFK